MTTQLPAARCTKIRFVVINENLLGYIIPQIQGSAQILASSPLRGASLFRDGQSYALPLDPTWVRSNDCPKPLDFSKVNSGEQAVKFDPRAVRAATRRDFDSFRISIDGYVKDAARYEFTAEQLAAA